MMDFLLADKRFNGRKRAPIQRSTRLSTERLEDRQMLDGTVVFNEIMYNPLGDDAKTEWVELHNQMSVDIDLSGWRIAGGIGYDFPKGTVLESGDYLVVASDTLTVEQSNGIDGVLGPFTGRMSNSGDELELRNHTNRLMSSVKYNDRGDWPVAADGAGVSVAKRDPQQATETASSWTYSEQIKGTPGAVNFVAESTFTRETLLEFDSEWKFTDSGDDLGDAWRAADFDDSAWKSGAGLFFDESSSLPGPKNTPLERGAVTFYFRTTFEFDAAGGNLDDAVARFRHIVDDGAVFYVNGEEVARSNLPTGPIDATTLAESSVRNAVIETSGGFDASILRDGTNRLAVELHQQSATSNDVVFGTELVLDRPIVRSEFSPDNVEFSEIAEAHGDFWFELANKGTNEFSLDGFFVESSIGDRVLLDGKTIEAGGRLTLQQADLGFAPEPGVKLYLYAPDRTQVVDAVVVRETVRARSAELDGRWQVPATETPGEPNVFELHDEIVINEILYHDRPTFSQPTTYTTEPFLPLDHSWRFHQTDADPGADWQAINFDDSAWNSGTGLFFNESSSLPGPKNTELELGALAYYFRSTFDWDSNQQSGELVLNHVVDDGAVFYLNGVEFSRFGMPTGDVTFETEADSSVRNASLVGPVSVPVELLVQGTNSLAVEVHQSTRSSNDVAFGVSLGLRTVAKEGTPFVESNDEWIELYNRSNAAVDVSNWQLDSGVRLTIPAGTTMAAGEYAIVARDTERFASQHPGVRVLGQFDGNLSNSGERIRLVDGSGNLADELRYFDGGYWPSYADGGGASLELIDPDADNSQPTAWAASDESARTEWQSFSYTDTVEPIVHDPPINFNELVIGLLDAGELLLDNVSVIEDPDGVARELIQNGAFEQDTLATPAEKWRAVGTHRESRVVADPDNANNKVLHLVTEGRSSYLSNHIETTLVDNTRVENGQTYQISFDAKWIGGSPQFRTELYYKDAARTAILKQPELIGTPGAKNSTAVDNAGPTLSQLSHAPVVPSSGDEVTIRTTSVDLDGISDVMLHYRVDERQDEFTALPMAMDADGSFIATIPPQANRDIVQFYVSSTDTLGATSVYPPEGPDSRALYKVDNSFSRDPLRHNFTILMTDFDTDELHRNVNMMDNNRRGSTVIYDGTDVFYDVGTRMRGSMFTRQARDRTGYNLAFHPDKMFRGVHGSVALDQNGKDEIFVKFVAMQSGNLGGTYDDVLEVDTPSGSGGGAVLAYLSRHTEMHQREQFENGEDGTLFKFEGIRVLTSTSDSRDKESLKLYQPIGWVGAFDIQDLGDNKELYRWPFLINRNRAKDDYAPLIEMAKAFSLQGDELQERVDELLDMDSWTHTFALMSLLGIGDAYSQGNPHNLNMFVRPSDGKILAFPWDWDFVYNQPATAPLHGSKNIGKILNLPPYERLLMGQMNEIMKSTLNTDYMTRWADHYGELIRGNLRTRLTQMNARTSNVQSRFPDFVTFQTDLNPPVVTTNTFVTPTSDAQIFIPTVENGAEALGLDWISPDFVTDDNWQTGSAAVGYSTGAFDEFIQTPIPEMKGVAPGAYLRIPFDVAEDQTTFDALKLKLFYDDGFVAYLNGVKVASANVSSNVDWDSRASGSRPNSDATSLATFDLGDAADLIQPGANILTIHGMNRSATGNDFLMSPELVGETVEEVEVPDVEVDVPTITVSGKAWIDIRHIRIAGNPEPLDVDWTSTTEWQVDLPLAPGRNEIVLEAYDFDGNIVSSREVNVVNTSESPADINMDWNSRRSGCRLVVHGDSYTRPKHRPERRRRDRHCRPPFHDRRGTWNDDR